MQRQNYAPGTYGRERKNINSVYTGHKDHEKLPGETDPKTS